MNSNIFYSTLGLLGGYILGTMGSDFGAMSFIIVIIIAFIVKGAREYHVNVLAIEYEYKEKELSAKDAAVKKAKVELQKEYSFTDEDFNDDARILIMKIVKNAKKTKTKVTGQSLLASILGGIR